MAKAQVLIVEDDAIIAMDIESQVKQIGYGVTGIVGYGEKAIEKVKENKPDLVLMDIILKGEMDGIEAAEEIRNQFGIPVIFLTAFADKDRLERAKLTYPFGFIIKPFQDKDLEVTIEMALYIAKVDAERRQAEERLLQESTIRGVLLDNLPCVALILKKGTREIVASNQAAKQIGAVPGKTCYETFAQRDDNCSFCLAPKLWATGDPQRLEVEYRGIYYECIWVPLTEELYVHYIFDITDRKQAEKALRESEERLQSFMDSATDGFILFDSELNHIEMNKVALEITGLERKDVIGKNVIDMVPNIKATGRYDEYKKVMKTGVPFHIPDLISHPLTGNKHVELNAFKVGDGLGIIFTDITERKRAEEALQESEEKYRSLFNNAEVGMFRTRADGSEILDMNEKFLDIFCRTREEMKGSPSVIHWADPSEREEMAHRLELEGRVTNFECGMLNKHGEVRRCLTSLRLYREQGILEGSIIDITERKQEEE